MTEARSYVPAAGHDWLLPFYDPLMRLLGGDRIKGPMIEAAAIRPGHRVLDLGCGTGSLAMLIRARCPEAEVVGLDPDPKALAIARTKAERAGQAIEWRHGFADSLPFEDASFDRVVSSLVFHHLPPDVYGALEPLYFVADAADLQDKYVRTRAWIERELAWWNAQRPDSAPD